MHTASIAPASIPPVLAVPAPQILVPAEVSWHGASNFYAGWSDDVADGGVFVATYLPHAIGTEVNVVVTLPEDLEIVIRGVVRWTREPRDPMDDSGGPPGMGVAFDDIAPRDLAVVRSFAARRAPLFHPE